MKWLRRCVNEVRWCWQRLTRGWDDTELWNLDHSLAKLILPRLRAFRVSVSGYPCVYGSSLCDQPENGMELWHAELHKMIAAFEYIAEDDRYWLPNETKDLVVEEGLALFAKRYRSLWD